MNKLEQSYKILDDLRLPNSLYLASTGEHYRHVWLRDSCFEVMPYLDKQCDRYEKTYHRILDLFKEYEWKLDIHTKVKPKYLYEYFHSRFHADTVTEITNQEWGHNQVDAVSAVLFGIGQGIKHSKNIIRDKKDLEIVQKIVKYLDCIEYWHCPDNGIWEENVEIHSSSVGAAIAGLREVSNLVDVPREMIDKGLNTLTNLYSRESESKDADLAQLTLVYPYRVLTNVVAETVVSKVEEHLLKSRGVIRYKGDSYYSALEEKFGRNHPKEFFFGTEAEWCFGLGFLALAHMELGNVSEAKKYIEWQEEVMLEDGSIPELYYAKSDKHNINCPLGWSNAIYILSKEKYEKLNK